MKRIQSYWGGASVLVVALGAGLASPACSSKFTDCAAKRSCVASGGSGEAEAGAPDQLDDVAGGAGRSSHAAGAGAPGLVVVEEGTAGEGGMSGANGDLGSVGAVESAGSGATGGSPVPVDLVPPSILSVTPVNGATQLTPTTDTIVITFSEPMNKASAESAYAPSGDAPKAAFSWNAAGTELSINPNLTYPAASDPAAPAQPFKFSVTTAAKDLAGNSLVAAVNWQFTLIREVTQSFGYSSGGNWVDETKSGSFCEAGDSVLDLASRGFMTYSISALPAGITAFESATIETVITGIGGDPFGKFGGLQIHSVSYVHTNQAAFEVPPHRDLGTFVAATGHNAVDDVVSKDVLEALKDDYANRVAREDRSQYRILFSSSPNSDGVADVARVSSNKSGNKLVVKYLFP